MPVLAFPVKGIAEPGILIEIKDNIVHMRFMYLPGQQGDTIRVNLRRR